MGIPKARINKQHNGTRKFCETRQCDWVYERLLFVDWITTTNRLDWMSKHSVRNVQRNALRFQCDEIEKNGCIDIWSEFDSTLILCQRSSRIWRKWCRICAFAGDYNSIQLFSFVSMDIRSQSICIWGKEGKTFVLWRCNGQMVFIPDFEIVLSDCIASDEQSLISSLHRKHEAWRMCVNCDLSTIFGTYNKIWTHSKNDWIEWNASVTRKRLRRYQIILAAMSNSRSCHIWLSIFTHIHRQIVFRTSTEHEEIKWANTHWSEFCIAIKIPVKRNIIASKLKTSLGSTWIDSGDNCSAQITTFNDSEWIQNQLIEFIHSMESTMQKRTSNTKKGHRKMNGNISMCSHSSKMFVFILK